MTPTIQERAEAYARQILDQDKEIKRLCRLLSEYDARLRKALTFTVMSGEQAEWKKDAKAFLGVKDGLPEI